MALGHFGMYEEWFKTFDPEQHKGEISELLVNVPEIRALYAKLVPLTLFLFPSLTLLWKQGNIQCLRVTDSTSCASKLLE